MKFKHKWADEIKAFVDGINVEYRIKILYEPNDEEQIFYDEEWTPWSKVYNLLSFDNNDDYEFRINPTESLK